MTWFGVVGVRRATTGAARGQVTTNPSATLTHMTEKVGIRELRQNLSRYVEQVKQGTEFVVTERGREVARLIPSGVADDPVLRLARERGATIPTGHLLDSLEALGPPLAGVDAEQFMRALDEQRADRI